LATCRSRHSIYGETQSKNLAFWQMFSKISTKDALQWLQHQFFFSHSCKNLHNKENTARNSLSKYGDLHLFFLKIWQPAHIFSRKNPFYTSHWTLFCYHGVNFCQKETIIIHVLSIIDIYH